MTATLGAVRGGRQPLMVIEYRPEVDSLFRLEKVSDAQRAEVRIAVKPKADQTKDQQLSICQIFNSHILVLE